MSIELQYIYRDKVKNKREKKSYTKNKFLKPEQK